MPDTCTINSQFRLCLLIVELHSADEVERLAEEQRVKPGVTENNYDIIVKEKTSKLATQLRL